MGIGAGDTVMLIMRNSSDQVVAGSHSPGSARSISR